MSSSNKVICDSISKKKEQKEQKQQKLKRNKMDSDNDEDYSDSDSEYIDEDDEYETISENDSEYSSDDDSTNEDNDKDAHEEDDDMNRHELQNFISKIFPSKYMSERVKNSANLEKEKEKEKDKKHKGVKKSTSSKNTKVDKSDKKKNKEKKNDEKSRYNLRKKTKKSNKHDEDDSDDYDSEYDDDYEEESELGSQDDFENEEEKRGFYSIILGLDDEDDEDAYNEEADDAECDSDDEQVFMKETYQKVEPVIIDSEQNDDGKKNSNDRKSSNNKRKNKEKKKNKKAHNNSSKTNDSNDDNEFNDVEQEYLELVEIKKDLVDKLNKKPKSKFLKHAVEDCNLSIKNLIKKARIKNAKLYHKLIHNDRKRTNEVDYFKKKLSNKEQLRIMQDLKEINKHINIERPYRLRLLESKMPSNFKAFALQKLNILKSMEPGDNEYYKIKNWVDTFMRIPFGVYKSLSVKMDDGMDVCNAFMENAKKTLDECTYGLNDAKMQIMQFMGQWIANPSAMGSAIAIHGPPGTGKTSIVKEGISKILGREFAFIALGGAGDSSFLEGHSYTYEGSSWGRIVQILIESKCMNPIIYFDELDKISETPRGEEIIGVLTHLTDTSQNSQFHDKYFTEVNFDLSKCLFIFSYNDESKVNPILKDRMYRIETKGYELKEKVTIARNYLLPKIREQVNFKEDEVIIPDDTIQYIVGNNSLTKGESGVRNLKRCLEIIHTKLNLFRLVKPDSELFGKDMNMKVSFPITVTRKDVDILIKNEEKQNQSLLAMYV